MADYREFCDYCNNEVGFGRHAVGCEAIEIAAAYREQRKREQQQRLDRAIVQVEHMLHIIPTPAHRSSINHAFDALRIAGIDVPATYELVEALIVLRDENKVRLDMTKGFELVD